VLNKRLSLSKRLFFAATIVLTAFLGLSAFSLNNAFLASADSAQKQRLKNYLYSILSAAEFNPNGLEVDSADLVEPRFSTPNSGLYGQITSGKDIVWQSDSILGQFIALPDHPAPSEEIWSEINIHSGEPVMNLAFGIVWEAPNGEEFYYTINVSEDLTALNEQKAGFQRNLWYWLGGTGLMLLIVQALILRWGLRPLYSVAEDLTAIESGKRRRLGSDYPDELTQLTDNINTLLDHEETRRQRYKNSLSDLAHSLKTPLAVFRGEIENSNDLAEIQTTGHEQLDRISALVNYQLQRAATEGKSSLLAPVSIADIIHKIVGSLDKVYQSKSIKSRCEIERNAHIHADEGDMYELLGNLIENAYKYCNREVTVALFIHLDQIEIRVDDDGNGIPETARTEITKRGKRIDTQEEGQGLGLAIVSDIIEAYQGEITVKASHLGGACFIVELPNH
jgi:two-component system sensor histidine kinase PhoQ